MAALRAMAVRVRWLGVIPWLFSQGRTGLSRAWNFGFRLYREGILLGDLRGRWCWVCWWRAPHIETGSEKPTGG